MKCVGESGGIGGWMIGLLIEIDGKMTNLSSSDEDGAARGGDGTVAAELTTLDAQAGIGICRCGVGEEVTSDPDGARREFVYAGGVEKTADRYGEKDVAAAGHGDRADDPIEIEPVGSAGGVGEGAERMIDRHACGPFRNGGGVLGSEDG
jgi:hypothetical protein